MGAKDFSEVVEARFKTRREAGLYKENLDKLAASKRVTIADIAYALEKHYGSINRAADYLGMEWTVLKRKVDTTPSLRQLQSHIKEQNLDEAEYLVNDEVQNGSLPAAIFLLKTKGKNRGYTERTETQWGEGEMVANTAAALIEAMRRGKDTAKALIEENPTIEVEEYQVCQESESPAET